MLFLSRLCPYGFVSATVPLAECGGGRLLLVPAREAAGRPASHRRTPSPSADPMPQGEGFYPALHAPLPAALPQWFG